MENLYKKKLEAVEDLKLFTEKIMNLSFKIEYQKAEAMIDERADYYAKVKEADDKIKESIDNTTGYKETSQIKNIKSLIRKSLEETIEMDKCIRKNLNEELKNVKLSLNQPSTSSKVLNVKA